MTLEPLCAGCGHARLAHSRLGDGPCWDPAAPGTDAVEHGACACPRYLESTALRIRALLCECGKVRDHETPCAPPEPMSVLAHAEAIVTSAKEGIAVALEAIKTPAFRLRTRCYTTYDSEGYAYDEYVDEILPAEEPKEEWHVTYLDEIDGTRFVAGPFPSEAEAKFWAVCLRRGQAFRSDR